MALLSIPRATPPSYSQGYARSAGNSARSQLWRDLRALWVPEFGATGTQLFDVSAYKNHATLAGSLTPATDWVVESNPRASGYSIHLDGAGTTDHLTAPALPALDVPVPYTFSASVRRDAGTPPTQEGIFGKWRQDSGFWTSYGMRVTGQQIHWTIQNPTLGDFPNWQGNTTIGLERWYRLTVVHRKVDGTSDDVELYVDGVLESATFNAFGYSSDWFMSYDSQFDVVLGARPGATATTINEWLGNLGSMAIWGRALSPSEVLEDARAPLALLAPVRRTIGRAPTVGGFVPYPRYALTGGMQSLSGV